METSPLEKLAIVIPAFNEEKSIAAVINDIHLALGQVALHAVIVVVNDCSIDKTKEIINNCNCIALNLPVNLGIGGAVQTGIKWAWQNGFDYVMQVDGDGQHPAQEIPKLISALQNDSADVVIGSRFIDKKGFQSSFARRIGINYFKYINKIIVGKSISDSTSGFRLINKKAMQVAVEYYPDEYPEPEAIILYSIHKLKIHEVAVVMKARQGGVSSINAVSSIYYMFKVSLAILFTYIRFKR
ncbi:MAG TPA: glycosyltransferase family 2 protein [Bacteroidia bacterium]|nr:glycosyltransferase family 2 protein [Bacteroidia bacterium]